MTGSDALIETHPDWSQTANGYVIRTAFQADLIKKANQPTFHSKHNLWDIVYIQSTQFKITGIAFYHTYVEYQLFGVINDQISMDWYTSDFFTTTPGPTIWFKV